MWKSSVLSFDSLTPSVPPSSSWFVLVAIHSLNRTLQEVRVCICQGQEGWDKLRLFFSSFGAMEGLSMATKLSWRPSWKHLRFKSWSALSASIQKGVIWAFLNMRRKISAFIHIMKNKIPEFRKNKGD